MVLSKDERYSAGGMCCVSVAVCVCVCVCVCVLVGMIDMMRVILCDCVVILLTNALISS